MSHLHELAFLSRQAALELATLSAESRNQALTCMASTLFRNKDQVFEANREDLRRAEESGLAAPLLKRLRFDDEKLHQAVQGLEELAKLEDPLGRTTLARELMPGLNLYRVSCPIGVIGIIFESRPDALIQITSLALKSGNAVILKGGSEAMETNRALYLCLRESAVSCGIPEHFASLLSSREDVAAMLKEDELIDLIIPRGSRSFVRYIMDNSRIPVLGHADGLCHVYVDRDADLPMAENVTVDSKTQNVSVCNAAETLLVHRDIAASFLPSVASKLRDKNVRLLGDAETGKIIRCEMATEEDWSTEYLDWTLSIRIVPDLDAAIRHINQYGSHHTDAIITENPDHAEHFMQGVDSSGVYWNCSTRFADGFAYGFGAEVGIATGKIHARGPMGLEGLTSYKYRLIGHGQTMTEVKLGHLSYTHRDLKGSME